MGLGKQQAYDMATSMTKLAYDMSSFYNLPVEEAFEKLSAGITGETEPLKRLGILVDENTVKQYAYANGIAKQGKELTQQQKIQARYGAIMKQTSKAQGDLARTIDSPVNQLRKMNTQLDMAKIALGQALQPALLAIVPVLTGMAIGATNVINALSGVGTSNDASLSEIAMTIDESRELVKKSVDTSTMELVDKINTLDESVNTALEGYMTAEKAVKKLQIGIEIDPPTTTGTERITKALDDLKALVPTTIDTTPITAKLDVIMADGVVTEKEEKTMSKTLNTWSKNAIKAITIDAKNKTKEIDAQIKAGTITEMEGSDLKKAVEEKAAAAISAVTVTVGTINVEIAAGADSGGKSLSSVSFSPDQAKKLGEAISAAANAQDIAITAEIDRVEATWAGTGTIGESVTGIYADAKTAFEAKNAELKKIAEQMLSGVATDQMWQDAMRIKEEIRSITAFMFADNADYGALFSQEFYANGKFASAKNILSSLDAIMVEATDASKKLLDERIGDIMKLPPDAFEAKFPGKTPADIIAELRVEAENELSAQKSNAIVQLAKSFMPGIAAAIANGDTSAAQAAISDFVSGLDFSKLDDAARQAVFDMLSALDLTGMGLGNLGGLEGSIYDFLGGIDYSGLAGNAKEQYDALVLLLGKIETQKKLIQENIENPFSDPNYNPSAPGADIPAPSGAQQPNFYGGFNSAEIAAELSSALSNADITLNPSKVVINEGLSSTNEGVGGGSLSFGESVSVTTTPITTNVTLKMDAYTLGQAAISAMQKVNVSNGNTKPAGR
jgi:hypothetical protein